MKYDPAKHHRRSVRLKEYDYAQPGAYFVTLVAYNRQCIFGQFVNGDIALSEFGQIVSEEWNRSAAIREEIELDAFIVMPNHIHGIVIITNRSVGATGRSPLLAGPPKHSLGAFIAGLKSAATKRINEIRSTPGLPIWQRNYYEHIIRDEESLDRIREYVLTNPAGWETDPENPAATARPNRILVKGVSLWN
jgi:REP-associated tyrosine transposase